MFVFGSSVSSSIRRDKWRWRRRRTDCDGVGSDRDRWALIEEAVRSSELRSRMETGRTPNTTEHCFQFNNQISAEKNFQKNPPLGWSSVSCCSDRPHMSHLTRLVSQCKGGRVEQLEVQLPKLSVIASWQKTTQRSESQNIPLFFRNTWSGSCFYTCWWF